MGGEKRAEDSGQGEAEARAETERVKAGASEEEFHRLDEEVEVADRREVESQRHRRERYGEEQLQHFRLIIVFIICLFVLFIYI